MFPEHATIREMYGPAMEITEQNEADVYFDKIVEHIKVRGNKEQAEAESIARQNLGYYAGYYSHETRDRVERLFKCKHPVFGSIAENGPPSAEQALAAGIAIARSM